MGIPREIPLPNTCVCVLVTSTRLHAQKHLWHDRGESSPATAQEDAQHHTARTLKIPQNRSGGNHTERVLTKQATTGNNNKLANTQPETPLAPHTTVRRPNTTPGVLQRAGCAYNHRCQIWHQHQLRPPHKRRKVQLKHPGYQAHCTT